MAITSGLVVRVEEDLRLDIVAARLAGSERGGGLERLLTANPGLSAQGAFLAAPRALAVPEPVTGRATAPSVNPWD